MVTCEGTLKVDIKLRIRLRTVLILRSVEWLVGNKSKNDAIIGRPFLNSLGCKNKDMLSAAIDLNAGIFDASYISISREEGSVSITSLISDHDGVYDSAAGFDVNTEDD